MDAKKYKRWSLVWYLGAFPVICFFLPHVLNRIADLRMDERMPWTMGLVMAGFGLLIGIVLLWTDRSMDKERNQRNLARQETYQQLQGALVGISESNWTYVGTTIHLAEVGADKMQLSIIKPNTETVKIFTFRDFSVREEPV